MFFFEETFLDIAADFDVLTPQRPPQIAPMFVKNKAADGKGEYRDKQILAVGACQQREQ